LGLPSGGGVDDDNDGGGDVATAVARVCV
jgi:hypothetical protein